MPTSAHLATAFGWESVFYIFGLSLPVSLDLSNSKSYNDQGGLGVLWHAVWIAVVRSAPHKDRFISNDELRYIQSMVSVEKEEKLVIPWKSIITSKPVLGITAAQFALNWSYNTMLTQMPTFLAGLLL